MNKSLSLWRYHYQLFLSNMPVSSQAGVVIKKFLRRQPWFHSLELGVTYQCQCDCRHCGIAGQKDASRKELSTEEIKTLLDDFSRWGGYFVTLAGAEPLLRQDIFELVKYAISRNLITILSTNGLRLDEACAEKLKKSHLAFLNVSLDSADGERHDAQRNHGATFQAVCRALKACHQVGLKAVVSTMVTPEMLRRGEVEAIIRFARQAQAVGVRLLPLVPSGKCAGAQAGTLTEADAQHLKELLDPKFVFIEGVCNTFLECNALLKHLFYLSPYGDLQPCSFVPLSFGNVRTASLGAMLRKLKDHKIYHRYETCDCMMRNRLFRQDYPDLGSPAGHLVMDTV